MEGSVDILNYASMEGASSVEVGGWSGGRATCWDEGLSGSVREVPRDLRSGFVGCRIRV